MTSFMKRTARRYLIIKAARQITGEVEQAGLAKLKVLAEADVSIIGTYLNGCGPKQKAIYRRELATLMQMGVTIEEILEEVAGQMPDIAPIMAGKPGYKKNEIAMVMAFLSEGG